MKKLLAVVALIVWIPFWLSNSVIEFLHFKVSNRVVGWSRSINRAVETHIRGVIYK